MPAPRSLRVLAGPLLLAFVAGCGDEEPIRSYTVDRPEAVLDDEAVRRPDADTAAPAGNPSRMMAAMVPHGNEMWFFKVQAPPEAVADVEEDVEAILASVAFESGEPTWELPEGWERGSGHAFRHATLVAPDGETELAVSKLSLRAGMSRDQFELINVNRWRGQLGLPDLAVADLKTDESVRRIEVAGNETLVIDILGKSAGTGRPPFAGGASPRRPAQPTPTPKPASEIAYDVPEGWTELPASGFRKAAFAIADGDDSAEVTVTSLGGDGGGLLANVNRWRGQVGLDAVDQAGLQDTTETVKVDGIDATLVDVAAPGDEANRQAILGAVVPTANGATWFVKFTGPKRLADRERDRFRAFLDALRLNSGEETDDGQ